MKLFELRRDVDEGGVSGTGVVAQGVIFDNGWCAMTWLTKHTSVAFYMSVAEVVAIHGHNGKTRVVQVADCDMDAQNGPRHLRQNMLQDECEGIAVEFTKGNGAYMWEQREKFARLFDEKRLGPDMYPGTPGAEGDRAGPDNAVPARPSPAHTPQTQGEK